MRRRVALVIGQLTRGGAEGQLAQVAMRIDRSRFEPIVYCLSGAVRPYGEEIEANGVRVQVVRGYALTRLRHLARHFLDDDIDVVHSWLFLANAATGVLQLVSPRRALITSARNRKLHGPLNRLANAMAFRLSHAIVANSKDVASYISEKYRAPADRIRVVVNGVDTQRFRPATNRDLARPFILAAGRLVEQKNHALFIEAAATLHRSLPTARFGILGEGPLRRKLESQARDLGLSEALTFLGERGDIESVLPTASLFWLTSKWEGMPNVVLEAMACGVPVIATDVGGARELIDEGETGFVVRSGDGPGFVAHSQALLSDAARWQQVGRAARDKAESFSVAQMVKTMERLYDEVGQ